MREQELKDVQQTFLGGDIKNFERFHGSAQLKDRLIRERNFIIVQIEQIAVGGNNGVFILENPEGKKLVAKFYLKDERRRLHREFLGCSFLREHDFHVPDPILRDDEFEFGVYSFEEGVHKKSANLTTEDVCGLADFLIHLHAFAPASVPVVFERGFMAQTSTEELLANNDFRIARVQGALRDGLLHPHVTEFIEQSGILDSITNLSLQSLKRSGVQYWDIPFGAQRLSTIDFGSHNALFRDAQPPCILDLEYFGWDDPRRTLTEFLAHDQTRGLPKDLQALFLHRYLAAMQLPETEVARLNVLIELSHIKWLAIYLQSLTPRYIEARKHASKNTFDLEAYVAQQLEKIKNRQKFIESLY